MENNNNRLNTWWKWNADFKNKILWIKNASQKSKSKLKNKLEIRLYTGFAMTVI